MIGVIAPPSNMKKHPLALGKILVVCFSMSVRSSHCCIPSWNFYKQHFFSTGISSRQHQKALESFTVTFFVQTECSKEERSRASGNRRWEFGATTENRSDRQPGYERGHLNSWLSPLLLCRRFLFCLKVCKFRPLPPSLTHPLCSPNHFWLHRSQCIYFFSVFFFFLIYAVKLTEQWWNNPVKHVV